MQSESDWSKRVYESSVSSRCWRYTPYDGGWDGCAAIAKDEELKAIVSMERSLAGPHEWADRIAETSIRKLPGCGHHRFPLAFLECLRDIGAQTPTEFAHGCYAVDSDYKRSMQDYCLCLDAWLAGARPEAVGAELSALGYRKIAWGDVCEALWNVLGGKTEMKELLVERLLHSQRWKIKFSPWDDDPCDQFGRDQYLGDFVPADNPANEWSYIAAKLPGIRQNLSPRVVRLESRLKEICPDWEWFLYTIEYGWLCSPKAFRHLECLLWSIGKEKPVIRTRDHPKNDAETVPPFLRCEDTYIKQDEAAQWWEDFLGSLGAWWKGMSETGRAWDEVVRLLGERTDVKRWLVRLMAHRCRMLAETSGSLGLLVHPSPSTRRGTMPLSGTLQS
ncbi:MAG TPA: hypothetical protein VMZ31_17495 [Phycisphaerae bacterium]|nr:hypothetical protein [Phycisphaerae bacterium]